MAKIENRKVLKRIEEDCFTSPGFDGSQTQLSDTVVPVVVANPRIIARDIAVMYDRSTTATNVTIGSTHATNRTFLTGFYISNSQSAASDNTLIKVNVTIRGKDTSIYRRHKLTLTAGDTFEYVTFKEPVEIDKGTNISFTLAFTVGASTTSIVMYGYEVEPQ